MRPERVAPTSRAMRTAILLLLSVLPAACQRNPPRQSPGRSVDVVITAVPLLTKELAAVYPFLKQDFAAGGVLEGKEVYAFVPSTITVREGDTLRLRLVNPEDDEHTFVLPDLFVKLPGQSVTDARWVARRPGIFNFTCVVPAHLPMMHGEIVVLPRRVLAP